MEFDPVLVHEWLRRSAKRSPDKEVLVFQDRRWTYAELDGASDRVAQGLMDLGVRRHDRVVVFLDTCPETVVALFGILKAGAAFVILNGTVKGDKLGYILRNCDARALITDANKGDAVAIGLGEGQGGATTIWLTVPEGSEDAVSWASLLESKPDRHAFPRAIDVDLAALIYTSGSTGDPKGVVSTHHNMISAARSIIQYVGNREEDVILNVLPLSFDYGLYQVIMTVMFGGTIILEPSFLFPHPVLKQIGTERVTGFPIVPTIVAMLLRMQDLAKYDTASLRYLTNTGAALPPDHIRRLREIFPEVEIISMFGLTECKRTCYLPASEVDRKPASVGKAMPNCEAVVIGSDGGETAPGEVGELVIRGANVMQGYWGDEERSAATFRPGRYRADTQLWSGDSFRRDEEGHLYFLGRHDDMIKSRGERVSGKEVENVIASLEGVAEVAVIGLPDEILGQAIKAFVAPIEEGKLTAQDVLKHCKARLEDFMMPKFVEFVRELPRSAHGKVAKKSLHGSGNQ